VGLVCEKALSHAEAYPCAHAAVACLGGFRPTHMGVRLRFSMCDKPPLCAWGKPLGVRR
jgi:hypothetical protein